MPAAPSGRATALGATADRTGPVAGSGLRASRAATSLTTTNRTAADSPATAGATAPAGRADRSAATAPVPGGAPVPPFGPETEVSRLRRRPHLGANHRIWPPMSSGPGEHLRMENPLGRFG